MTQAKQRSVSATTDDWEGFKAAADALGINPSAMVSAIGQGRLKVVPAMDNATMLLAQRLDRVEDAIEDLRRMVVGMPPRAPTELP